MLAPPSPAASPDASGDSDAVAGPGPGLEASSSKSDRRFRPIAEELRELEKRRMEEALTSSSGVRKVAAELISMPLRTFTMKLKQYGLGNEREGSDEAAD